MLRSVLKIILCVYMVSCNTSKKQEEAPISKVKSTFLQTYFYDFEQEFSEDCDTVVALKNWKRYHNFKNFLSEKYQSSNAEKALLFSDELADLTKKLKDSLWILSLNNRAFFARLNVLESEVLRLKDMATIKSITAKQVYQQVKKIFSIHDALVAKINDIYATKEFERNVNFDQTIFYFNIKEVYYKPIND